VFLISKALKKHPVINSSWQDDHVLQYNAVHMGFAVSLPGGLMTPVVRNADSKSLIEISKETKALIAKARDGKLQPDDYAGGTFTISNLGMNGIEEFTAIINPPQAAILAIAATIPTPVVSKTGAIVVEERMKVTLSCDHRVIDGVAGSEFLKTLKLYVEDPISALFLS
jgi:pyruvate dehydrogenase E2 component (dihydrolipoamide acetyltransferase)